MRKESAHPDYNERLTSQKDKQESFFHQTLTTPSVHQSGFNKGLFFFDMTYIEGTTYSMHLQYANIREASNSFTDLIKFIQANNELETTIAPKVFKKINDLKAKLNSDLEYYFSYCMDFDWDYIKESYCHGDLHFENILWDNRRLNVIDFLDSFCNAQCIDISRLLLDLVFFWSYRNSQSQPPFVKYIYLYNQLKENFSPLKIEAATRMLCLGIMRIFPYCSSKKEMTENLNRLKYMKEFMI